MAPSPNVHMYFVTGCLPPVDFEPLNWTASPTFGWPGTNVKWALGGAGTL